MWHIQCNFTLSSPASWGKLQKLMSEPCDLSLILLQWMPTFQKYLFLCFFHFFFRPYSTALLDVLRKALMLCCCVLFSSACRCLVTEAVLCACCRSMILWLGWQAMPALVAITDLVPSCFPLCWAFIHCCSNAISKRPRVFLPSFVQLRCQEYMTGRFWSMLQVPACQAVANRYRSERWKEALK